MTNRPGRSLWADTMPDDEVTRPLPGAVPTDVDVAIIGAGFTGLWTAWYLATREPTIRVAVLERETIGFGASGRNGGWSSALLPMGLDRIASRSGAAAASRLQQAMHDTVDEVTAFIDTHADPTIYQRGGTIDLARSPAQATRLRHEIDTYRRFGFGDQDYRWLEPGDVEPMCAATRVVGALQTPHCAAIQPLRLVHALARACVAAGVDIYEGVDVEEVHERRLVTSHGTIAADTVVRATEGYTCRLPGEKRSVVPIYSLMIATEPLSSSTWSEIGLADRPTFADGRHLIIYGQRTADDRFAFGGRGAPYHFGSAIKPEFDTDDIVRARLTDTLRDLFPQVGDALITHHWGGVLGAPRDWHCSVRFDRRTGTASAGGYVGDGVSTTNLAGRSLAALILDEGSDADRELVSLPWIGHRSPRWEPEPFRWFGINAGRAAAKYADVSEQRTGRRSRVWGGLVDIMLRR